MYKLVKIALRKIFGIPFYVSNRTLLDTARYTSIHDRTKNSQNPIYKYSFSKYQHLRVLGRAIINQNTFTNKHLLIRLLSQL